MEQPVDYTALRAKIRRFVEENVSPGVDDDFVDEHLNPNVIPALARAGYLGFSLPRRYGGHGQDYRALAILCEELGRIDIAHQITVTVHLALSALTILQWGDEQQRDHWLPALARGERLATFALTEPDVGSDPGALRSSARRTDGGYILNGEKAWISLANVADAFVVFATLDPKARHRGICAFLVDRGAPGLQTTTYHGKLGVRASNTGSVFLKDVGVSQGALLGREGEGFAIALSALNNGLFTVGAGAVGAAEAARESAICLMRERSSRSGSPLPAVGLLSNVATAVERARLLIEQAAELKNRGLPSTQATSLAKWQAAEAAFDACQAALDLFEVLGEPPPISVARHLYNVKGSVIYGGTREIHTTMQGAFALHYRQERPFRCPAPSAADLAGA